MSEIAQPHRMTISGVRQFAFANAPRRDCIV